MGTALSCVFGVYPKHQGNLGVALQQQQKLSANVLKSFAHGCLSAKKTVMTTRFE